MREARAPSGLRDEDADCRRRHRRPPLPGPRVGGGSEDAPSTQRGALRRHAAWPGDADRAAERLPAGAGRRRAAQAARHLRHAARPGAPSPRPLAVAPDPAQVRSRRGGGSRRVRQWSGGDGRLDDAHPHRRAGAERAARLHQPHPGPLRPRLLHRFRRGARRVPRRPDAPPGEPHPPRVSGQLPALEGAFRGAPVDPRHRRVAGRARLEPPRGGGARAARAGARAAALRRAPDR